MIESIKRVYRYFFKNPPKSKLTTSVKIERHGSTYGGWNIVKDSINSNSIIYSFGIGEDISFDLSIIKKYGCSVYGYDPTPRVNTWLESQQIDSSKFIFNPIGLGTSDGYMTFYEPLVETNVSHTSVAGGNTKSISVSCLSLGTMLKLNGHDKIDLLKMDIEGFEVDVLPNMIENGICPKQLLVEFHHFFPDYGNKVTEEMISYLESKRYRLFNVSDSFCEYSFLYCP